MDSRNRPVGFLLLLLCLLVFSGCGGEEDLPASDPTMNPDRIPSCETLEPQLFQDPLSGGAFHCLWCNREWKWTLTADSQHLFVLIAVTCDRLGSEAYLQIREPPGAVVWQQQVEQGDNETICIRCENPLTGVLSVRLYGHRDFTLITNLIEEFRGSVYLKVFNEQGDLAGFRSR